MLQKEKKKPSFRSLKRSVPQKRVWNRTATHGGPPCVDPGPRGSRVVRGPGALATRPAGDAVDRQRCTLLHSPTRAGRESSAAAREAGRGGVASATALRPSGGDAVPLTAPAPPPVGRRGPRDPRSQAGSTRPGSGRAGVQKSKTGASGRGQGSHGHAAAFDTPLPPPPPPRLQRSARRTAAAPSVPSRRGGESGPPLHVVRTGR